MNELWGRLFQLVIPASLWSDRKGREREGASETNEKRDKEEERWGKKMKYELKKEFLLLHLSSLSYLSLSVCLLYWGFAQLVPSFSFLLISPLAN